MAHLAWQLAILTERVYRDTAYACRVLRRDFAFTIVVISTLALAIGLNITVFSAMRAVLLRPLPYPDPDRLMWVTNHSDLFHTNTTVGPDFIDWRSEAKSFDALTAYKLEDKTLVDSGEASSVRIVSVAGDFWSITGTVSEHGRLPAADEPNAIVLSHRLYQTRFHADPGILGKTVKLDGRPFTVVAVLPQTFRFLFPHDRPVTGFDEIDGYASLRSQAFGSFVDQLDVVGRLRPGVSTSQATAEILTLQTRMLQSFPGRMGPNAGDPIPQIRLQSLGTKILGSARLALLVLFAAVFFVLLIGCSNITSLTLARVNTRQKEVAIRASVGATRSRIATQFLIESLVLTIAGGVLGVLLSHWISALILQFASKMIPRLNELDLDASTLMFALALSLGTGILLGGAPIILLFKTDLNAGLKQEGGRLSARSIGVRGRELVVVLELTLTMVLLTAAGLMLKSFWRMTAYPQGFEPQYVLVMHVALSGPVYLRADGEEISQRLPQSSYMRRLVSCVESAPGVIAGGIAVGSVGSQTSVGLEGTSTIGDGAVMAIPNAVSAGYFRAFGVRLVKGNWFSANGASDETLINESLAQRLFANSDPIGKRVQTLRMSGGGGKVIGVVSDSHYPKLDAQPHPEVYFPYLESPSLRAATIVIRTNGDPLAIAQTMRKRISEIDASQAVYDVAPLEQVLLDSIAPRRFEMVLLTTFAATACALAIIGIYGLISYIVALRTHEIGVRMALGAQARDVVGMLISKAMTLTAAGIVLGIVAAAGLTRLMGNLLYAVSPTDFPTFVIVGVAFAATALLAAWIPSRRAAAVSPLDSIRLA